MKKASPLTLLQVKKRAVEKEIRQQQLDLNIFVVTFNGMKQAENHISGGDPYTCLKCKAILNKFSVILSAKELSQKEPNKKVELKNNESLWQCEFCGYPNVIKIDKQQIPTREDTVYLVESEFENMKSQNDSTMVFCIDCSGSMNTTSQIEGKVDLKFGLSQQQIDMLKQFMQPGDQAQFNYLPGNHNNNKTFISRKQCILSAIESQLKQLKKSDPNKKVGFITFNNEVTVIGDSKTPTVNILGDKLQSRQSIIDSLADFKLNQSLEVSYESLISQLNKQQAKGQTALGPALVSAIEVVSKGSPGSTVLLCTDGLANIGIGLLDPMTEENKQLYEDLAQLAKQRNISVNIMTIKGQGCKMQVIGRLAELTNGNMKVVNPENLANDFANVLKDEVVGLNVDVTIQLHKAMVFRNEDKTFLSENETVLKKKLANATANSKISFEYQLRCEQDLKFMEIDVNEIKKVPFQTQILYTSPKGAKYLRVVSSESNTTTDKKQILKDANIAVAHQRITSLQAQTFAQGNYFQQQQQNHAWSNYLSNNFTQQKYSAKNAIFAQKSRKVNRAINNKMQKKSKKIMKNEQKQEKSESKKEMNKSQIDSDQDQMQLMDCIMEKGAYDMSDEEC